LARARGWGGLIITIVTVVIATLVVVLVNLAVHLILGFAT
jgi:hypothetical protein